MGIFRDPDIEKLQSKRDVKGLIKALKDEHVRWRAIDALKEIGEPAVESLTHVLESGDKDLRREATRALGMIGTSNAVESLIQALKDENWHVRGEAAKALEEIGDVRVIEHLTQALNDENSFVQKAAKTALESIRAKKI